MLWLLVVIGGVALVAAALSLITNVRLRKGSVLAWAFGPGITMFTHLVLSFDPAHTDDLEIYTMFWMAPVTAAWALCVYAGYTGARRFRRP